MTIDQGADMSRYQGLVALDGTKVQGNASLDANRTAASIKAEIGVVRNRVTREAGLALPG